MRTDLKKTLPEDLRKRFEDAFAKLQPVEYLFSDRNVHQRREKVILFE